MTRATLPGLLLAIATVSVAHAAAPPTLAPGALHPGQKAIVHTVFAGTAIESFEAEIVGVLRGGAAGGDLILGRATTERVAKSGIAQGMSGSPVYVDGKLIGALSSGWAFSRDPVFGITPIGEMLPIFDQPEGEPATGANEPSGFDVGSEGRTFGPFAWAGADETFEPSVTAHRPGLVAPEAMALRPLPLPVACAGLQAAALEQARGWLAPFGLSAVPGGVAAAGVATTLEPGGAAAVELMRGDLQLSAIGTVTWRDGDRVLLFGHPFFQSGAVRLPLATAEIVTIVASDQVSFKVGASAAPIGVVTQDRRTGVAGRLGGSAHMLPIGVTVEGVRPRTQRFRFQSIEDRTLAPTLIAIATLNSLLESGGVGGRQTMRWTLRLHRAGTAPLEISDVATGESPPAEVAQGIVGPLAFLWNNPYERLSLDSVSVVVRASPGRSSWILRSARLLDSVVRPGGRVRVLAELERWQGARTTREIMVEVPAEAPDGRYVLFLGGSRELSRYEARGLPGRYRPTSLADAWRRLAGARPAEGLFASLTATAPEVTSDGRDYPELPISALSLLAPSEAAGTSATRGSLAILDERRLAVEGPVTGQLVLAVRVDRKAP